MPVLVGVNNCRLGKAKFHPLKNLLDSGARSSIVLGKRAQNLRKENTTPVHWKTQGDEFQTKHKSKV